MNKQTILNIALPITVAVLLMGVSCYYQGIWSERWGEFPELQIFAEQLKEVPKKFGEWEAVNEGQTDERIKQISGAAGEISRTYQNAAGEQVRVMVMCARFRDVFYHTPDRCYPAAGFEMQSEPQREIFETSAGDAQFFTAVFLKSEPTGTQAERGYWSWTADGKWQAPSNEKLSFAGERALYKMYVFGTVPTGSRERTDQDFCGDFIKAFIPVLNTALRPGFEKAGRVKSDAVATTPAPAPAPAAQPAPAQPAG